MILRLNLKTKMSRAKISSKLLIIVTFLLRNEKDCVYGGLHFLLFVVTKNIVFMGGYISSTPTVGSEFLPFTLKCCMQLLLIKLFVPALSNVSCQISLNCCSRSNHIFAKYLQLQVVEENQGQ